MPSEVCIRQICMG